MAITPFQQKICHLISDARKQNGASYIAGGVSLNTCLNAPRISHDIDIFNDSHDALIAGWEDDKKVLEQNNYSINILRERSFFIEAIISDIKTEDSVILQWTCDSAFRFFPLIEHDDFGLTLHPFDLATNKALALVGRLEVRDWIDMVTSHDKIQHIGLLLWAACGKDPGFSPTTILAEARRSAHYTQVEIDSLIFEKNVPDATHLSEKWKQIMNESEKIIDLLPIEEVGKCILDEKGQPFNASYAEIQNHIQSKNIRFHEGTLYGSFPVIKT